MEVFSIGTFLMRCTEGAGFVAVIFKLYLPEPTLRVLRMLKWEALLTLGL